MKEFVISDAQAETAVLVGLITQTQNERKTNEYLDELEFLAHTAGAVTVKRFTQKVNGPNSVTYVGKGKLEEIRAYIEAEEEAEREIGMVIFDDELSAKQLRNIEKELKVKILDRTSLILDIFAMRAQTANAKTQVELAQYRYMLPRLQRLWTHLERQGGGSGSGGGKGSVGLRGPGDTVGDGPPYHPEPDVASEATSGRNRPPEDDAAEQSRTYDPGGVGGLHQRGEKHADEPALEE